MTPATITKLQAASVDYCVAHAARFDALADLLRRTDDATDGGDGDSPRAGDMDTGVGEGGDPFSPPGTALR